MGWCVYLLCVHSSSQKLRKMELIIMGLLGLFLSDSVHGSCNPCVTVFPLQEGDTMDPFAGIYNFLGEDPECPDGCSYTKSGGAQDEVYCFKQGEYSGEYQCQEEATQGSTVGELTSTAQLTTDEPISTGQLTTTVKPTSTAQPTTTTGPISTGEPTTTAEPTSTAKPTTKDIPTTTAKPSTFQTSPTGEPTSTSRTKTSNIPISSAEPTTTDEPTSTGPPTTSGAATSTGQPTSTSASTSTGEPTTTGAPTSTGQPTTGASTSIGQPTTTGASSSTGEPTTTGAQTTTDQSTSTNEPTSTAQPTTTDVPSTSDTSTAGQTTASATTSVTTSAATTSTSTTGPSCDSGWEISGDTCYKLDKKSAASYSDAQKACAALGGVLAAPKTQVIQDLLLTLSKLGPAADFWVGIDDIANEGTFVFSDGTTFTKTGGTYGSSDVTWSTDFTWFKDSQPSSVENTRENQDCVKVGKTTERWDDVRCAGEKNYACEKPLIPSTATTEAPTTQTTILATKPVGV